MTEQDYNPFEHRQVEHPTSDFETFGHVVKAVFGVGILVMPYSFLHAGLWFGLFATIGIGIIITYAIHLLVQTSYVTCRRARVPSMHYSEVVQAVFDQGPKFTQGFNKARLIMDVLLCTELLITCTVYVIFIAANLKQVIDYYTESYLSIRIYMLALFPLLASLSQIRTLKYLAPISILGNILITISVGICYYYVLTDIPPISERPVFADAMKYPTFFGSVIFSLVGIAIMMHLENEMKHPEHFTGCCGVLNFGMGFVIISYCLTGFIGYLKYGEDTLASLSLNLPQSDFMAKSVNVLMSLAILLTFSLGFHVAANMIWNNFKDRLPDHQDLGERLLRLFLSMLVFMVAILVPTIGPLVSLIGALILSVDAIIIPAFIHIIAKWDVPELFAMRLILDSLIIIFGIVGLITGTYTSMLDIIASYELDT